MQFASPSDDSLATTDMIMHGACHGLACVHEHLHQQTVLISNCIEVVDLSRVRSIGRVGAAQRFPWELCQSCMCEEWDEARDGASSGSSHPPHSRRHRSRHLTKNPLSRALITEWCAPKSKNFVDYRTHKTGKMLPHVKYSSKRSDFLRFYA